VHLLLKDGGTENLLGLFSDCGGGQAFDAVFEKTLRKKRWRSSRKKLADELKSR